ncbi:MAG: alpha/beta hydrolase [Symploca sp. SIO2D2]|nr:alpha/beta hydrolase [Symploca sp. SIO2D2]
MLETELASPDNVGTKINLQELQAGSSPVVLLVNGFGGCAPCITRILHKKLQLQSISVYDLDWNDIYLRRRSVYLTFTDTKFIQQMVELVIPTINSERPIILIGESLGGDAILEVAARIRPRKIDFLGIIDSVNKLGQRTTKEVPANVNYFYNRWTKNPSLPRNIDSWKLPGTNYRLGIPLNASKSGELFCQNPSTYSDQQEQSYGYNADGTPILVANTTSSSVTKQKILTHACKNAIYKDPYIQQQIFEIIKKIDVKSHSAPNRSS